MRAKGIRLEQLVLAIMLLAALCWNLANASEIKQLLADGKLDRPDEPSGPAVVRPVTGSSIPRAGKRFRGEGDAAPQGA